MKKDVYTVCFIQHDVVGFRLAQKQCGGEQ